MPDPAGHPSDPPRRTLLLLRHAKAESGHGDDHARHLNAKGHRQAEAVGGFLAEQGLQAQAAVFSSATRTTETLRLVESSGGLAPGVEAIDLDTLYTGGTDEMLSAIAATDDDVSVLLVVGHEPTVSRTATTLLDEDSSDPGAAASVRVGLPTGGLAILRLPTAARWVDVRRGTLRLETVVRP
jgi:phosphohistidine phosphatase